MTQKNQDFSKPREDENDLQAQATIWPFFVSPDFALPDHEDEERCLTQDLSSTSRLHETVVEDGGNDCHDHGDDDEEISDSSNMNQYNADFQGIVEILDRAIRILGVERVAEVSTVNLSRTRECNKEMRRDLPPRQ